MSFCGALSLMAVPPQKTSQGDTPKALLSCKKINNQEGAHLSIAFQGGPGNPQDWIGVYPKGVIPQHGVNEATLWSYVGGSQSASEGKVSGTVEFTHIGLPDGEYVVYFLKNDGYEIINQPIFFTVGTVKRETVKREAVKNEPRSVLMSLGGVSVVLKKR